MESESRDIEYLGKGRDFLHKALKPEKRKFVLPVVMSMLLIAGAASALTLQESYSKKSTSISLETMTELQALKVRNESFKDSLNSSAEKIKQEITREAERQQEKLQSQPLLSERRFLAITVFRSGAFPLIPDKHLAPWGSQRDYAESMALLIYRKEKINQLAGKANRSENYSYSEFREDLENIKGKSWKDREVQRFLDNYSAQEAANIVGMIRRSTLEVIKSGNASEMSYISFLPSVLATFALYYLIGALAVEGNRRVNESFTPVKRPDEKGEESTDEESKGSKDAENE